MVSGNESNCPKCGGKLKPHDRVKRLVRTKHGKTYWTTVERNKCTKCGRKHRVLPEILLPYKHYEAGIIKGFISGVITSFDLEYEDYPCDGTIKIWKKEHEKHLLCD